MSEQPETQETSTDQKPRVRSKILKIFCWTCLGLLLLSAYPIYIVAEWFLVPSVPDFKIGDINQIQIKTYVKVKPKSEDKNIDVRSNDKQKIEQLLNVLAAAKRTYSHKCSSTGSLAFYLNDDTKVELKILPGHDEEYYEYRYQSRINKVNRKEFLAAIKALGVTRLQLESLGKLTPL